MFEITNVNTASSTKKVKASFLFLIVYFMIFLFSKGILVQELTHHANYNPLYFSVGMIASYSLALFLIIWHANNPHLRIIVYIANSLMIIGIVISLLSDNSSWMLLLIYSIIYFSLSVNEVFCFDSFFEFGELFGSGALVFGIAFTSGSLAQLGGVLFFEFNDQAQVLSADLIVIILIALLTLILPIFLIELSKVSAFSVFRVSYIQYYQGANQLSPAETSMQVQEVLEHDDRLKNFTALDVLTNRENEVLELVLMGLPLQLISKDLYISDNTLKKHVSSIYSKLNVHTRSELFLLLKKDFKRNK